jgi:Raf kinase inhibitor-like YbhB/YbcL family protein
MLKKTIAGGGVLLAIAFGALLAQDKGKGGGGGAPKGPGLTLTSPDLVDGGVIPDKFTQKAGPSAASPKLEWTNVPAGVVSFALLFHDPDGAPQKKVEDVTHWMMFNIPGDAKELGAGISADAKLADGTIQIKNTRGAVGFMGPGAGAAGPYHHYTFELFALDTKLDLTADATRADVMKAMDGHIIAKGVLEGRFHQ